MDWISIIYHHVIIYKTSINTMKRETTDPPVVLQQMLLSNKQEHQGRVWPLWSHQRFELSAWSIWVELLGMFFRGETFFSSFLRLIVTT
jgi:hypothetical protein